MKSVDDLIKDWLRAKFLESHYYKPLTMGGPEFIKVLSVDSGWECDCYSEYTRGDQYVFTATIEVGSGKTVQYPYGSYSDLPQFMMEIADMEDNDVCPHESYDSW